MVMCGKLVRCEDIRFETVLLRLSADPCKTNLKTLCFKGEEVREKQVIGERRKGEGKESKEGREGIV